MLFVVLTRENKSINPNNVSIPREFHIQNKGFHIRNSKITSVKPKLEDINLMLSSSNNVDILDLCETFYIRTQVILF